MERIREAEHRSSRGEHMGHGADAQSHAAAVGSGSQSGAYRQVAGAPGAPGASVSGAHGSDAMGIHQRSTPMEAKDKSRAAEDAIRKAERENGSAEEHIAADGAGVRKSSGRPTPGQKGSFGKEKTLETGAYRRRPSDDFI